MKQMNYYINGIGIISPQRTFNNNEFLPEITQHNDNHLNCVVPDFKEFINPIQLRRLSRMLRVGLSSAVICVRDSNNIPPDGIITGTGYGFLTDTGKFLTEIYDYKEKQLTPTYFMQSTYNALAGLVALTLKCKGYNNTYVNKGFAFETSLHDAMMQLAADDSRTFLVGGYDERDDAQYRIHLRAEYYKHSPVNNLQLFEQKTKGTIQGEGAAFFSVSGKPSTHTWCILAGMKMIFIPENKKTLAEELKKFLALNGATVEDIDVVVNGVSGDVKNDELLEGLVTDELAGSTEVRFKHLCGEYCTASSFGLWLGASILKKQEIPDSVKFTHSKNNLPMKTALLINQYMGRNYSFMLLKAV